MTLNKRPIFHFMSSNESETESVDNSTSIANIMKKLQFENAKNMDHFFNISLRRFDTEMDTLDTNYNSILFFFKLILFLLFVLIIPVLINIIRGIRVYHRNKKYKSDFLILQSMDNGNTV
ncbi:hypothetical protein HHI36_022111 [Cryptolaemus montrouzieri]|uniref:Uncharacterized protein n=1 Tax=Cryptolaemus montrouzieri TaxID=559131 RepID=A0ABD2MZ79_9CUCU